MASCRSENCERRGFILISIPLSPKSLGPITNLINALLRSPLLGWPTHIQPCECWRADTIAALLSEDLPLAERELS